MPRVADPKRLLDRQIVETRLKIEHLQQRLKVLENAHRAFDGTDNNTPKRKKAR